MRHLAENPSCLVSDVVLTYGPDGLLEPETRYIYFLILAQVSRHMVMLLPLSVSVCLSLSLSLSLARSLARSLVWSLCGRVYVCLLL